MSQLKTDVSEKTSLIEKSDLKDINEEVKAQDFQKIYQEKLMRMEIKGDRKYEYTQWTKSQLSTFRRYILSFGYNRWGKIRQQSGKVDKMLEFCSDREMRPYANWFLVALLRLDTEDFADSQKIVGNMIKVPTDGGDHQLGKDVKPKFYGESVETRAKVWLRRLKMLENSNKLVRQYLWQKHNYKGTDHSIKQAYQKNMNLLGFIPSQALVPQKPSQTWTIKHDCDLLIGIYKYGFGNYEEIFSDKSLVFGQEDLKDHQIKRMTDRYRQLLLVVKKHSDNFKKFDFESEINSAPTQSSFSTNNKEPQDLSLQEQHKLYQILINFGIPSADFDDLKDDYDVLRVIIQKYSDGEESIPILGNQHTNHFAKFVRSLIKGAEIVVQKYDASIQLLNSETLLGKRTFSEQCDDTSPSKYSDNPSSPSPNTNIFIISPHQLSQSVSIDKEKKLKTVFKTLAGFQLDFKKSVTLTKRLALFKLVRKEMMSHRERMWDHYKDEFVKEMKPEAFRDGWRIENDKAMMGEVSKYGFPGIDTMYQKEQFTDVAVIHKQEMISRVEEICWFFSQRVLKFKENVKSNPQKFSEAQTSNWRGGDYTYGRTRLNMNQNIAAVRIERDEEGNVKYPIKVSDTLKILNLGIVEYERQTFHSARNIFPIGFKSVREYASMFKQGQRCDYICEILDGGHAPVYKVTCMEDPDNPIIRDASSGAWIEVCKKINDVCNQGRTKVTVSGPDRYGLAEPSVTQLMASLPNADKCAKFRPPNGWSNQLDQD